MSERFGHLILLLVSTATGTPLHSPNASRTSGDWADVAWPTWLIVTLTVAFLLALFACRRSRQRRSLELHRLRCRIAADLHDDIGSSLSQVAIMSEVASKSDARQAAALEEIACVSREVLESLSEIVWALDPNHDQLHDLTERMRWFAGELLSARGISLNFQVSGPRGDRDLSTDVRRQVFLIFKECVNNIARHSGAAHVTVVFGEEKNSLLLQVRDDGRGFEPKQATCGHGLGSIRRRTRMLGGGVETQSQPGKGTSLHVWIPIPIPKKFPKLLLKPHQYAGKNQSGHSNMAAKSWPYPL